jgi:hypothetical protein
MWLMPSKHWWVRPSGDLCRLRSIKNAIVQRLVEIAHTDEDGTVHEQPLSRLDLRRRSMSASPTMRTQVGHLPRSEKCRYCSLIPGFGVKLSAMILAGPTVLCAVGACPSHDGVRRRWWINVASSQKIGRSHHRHRPGRDIFPACCGNPLISLWRVTRQPPSSTS